MISRYLIAATFALSASALWGKETNPPAGKAGDPPSSQNCTDCHEDGVLNNGDSNFTITGLPSFYTPNRTYELNLLLDKNATGYGFQAIAKDVNNTAGSFTPVSSGITVDGEYIEHNTPSTTGQWTFKWTAPSTDVGLVTFYASGLVANSNSDKTGDSVYSLTVDINSSSSQNIPQVQDLVWSQQTRGAIYSSPTIGSDGTIYVGSGDDKLYAFYPDGGVKWTYQAGEWVDSTPAIADDGTIYVGSWDNKVHAINPDGTAKWTFSTDSLVLAGPAVGPDGTIYVGSHDNFFYALEANGSVKWEYFAEQPVSSSAALGQDGTIYFGDDNGTFHAVNPDGTSKWTYVVDTISESNSSIESSPALDLYGYIYFGSANGYCYSLEDNGTNGVLRWKYATADRVDSSPVIGLSNEVFFMSRDGYLRSIDIDFGVTNWEKPIGDVFYSSPVVDENGTVYVVGYLGGGENHIFAIDANGSMDWNSSMTNHSVVIGDVVDSSLAIDANGTLYFGSFDKKLYAVKAGWNLADSDWPKFRRDNSGTGRWPSYQIDANASPVGSGTIAGAGVHNQGATASLTATPATGYSFSHWSGDSNETNATITLVATQPRSVTAHFTLNSYTLGVTGGTGGSVSGAGVFNHWTVAAITANPDTGYSFTTWTGDGIADLNAVSTTVPITQDINVTATFTINRHTLTAFQGVGGSVSGGGTFDWNSSAPILATPNTGYSFTGWIGTGITNPSDANTTVLMTEDRNVSATFLINSYDLSIFAGTTGGNVSSSGSHNHGTQASITATPQTGYSFIGWNGQGIADLNASTTTVDMTQDRNVSASFAINSYTLLASAASGGSVSGSGTFDWNSSAPITATPNTGYSFTSWLGTGITSPSEANTTVLITEDRNVSATFLINSYVLSIIAGTTGGNVSSSGSHNHGTQAAITATPQTGYSFIGWSGEGIADLNATTTTIDMTQDRNASASFSINRYTLLTSSDTGGSVTGAGTFDWNSTASIVVTVNTGYEFTGWTGTGVNDAMALSTTVAMTQDRNITATFAIKSYALTTNASAGGTTSLSGTYDHGTQATITATPQTGYSFTGWSGEAIADINASTTTIDMTLDRNVTANFDTIIYSLIVSSASGGAASGSGSFGYGTNAPITATAASGHYFTNWTGEGITDADSLSTTVSMTQDRNVTASFSPIPIDKKILQTYSKPIGSGSTSGSGPYDENTVVNLSTTSAQGYHFLGWTATGGTLASPLSTATTITLDQGSDANATAHFDALINEIAIASPSGGSVTGDGNYSHGQLATIKAIPEIGYSFSGWEVNGTMNFTVTVAARQYDGTSNAFFLNGKENPPLTLVRGNVYQFLLDGSTTASHPFYFSEDTGGGGNPSLAKYTNGVTGSESTSGTVAITVGAGTPDTLYYYCANHPSMGNIIKVVDSTALISDGNASTTAVDTNASYVLRANFSLNQHLLAVNAGPGGSVSTGGTFAYGTDANISATPDSGYIFTHWSGSGPNEPTSSTTTASMTENRSITANFELGSYTLNLAVNASGGGTVLGGGNYEFGQTVNIFASPFEGYRFVEWTGGNPADANAFGTTVTITASQTITATFASSNHDLLLIENIEGAGTLTGSGNYPHGSDVNVTATASSGYVFTNWSGNGIADENATATTISLTSDLNVTANFESLTYPLNLSAEPSGGGTVVGSGRYVLGSSVNIVALPTTGYQFIGWIGGNPADANNSATIVTVTGSADIRAEFEKLQYNVSIAVSPVGAATVSGGGTYQHGDTVSLVSTPIKGYEFSHWSGANWTDTNSSDQSFTVSGDLNLVANYERHADAGTLFYALDATELEAGWQESSWFGYFHQTTPEWAYHFDFGWIYTKPENDSSMWFWTQRFGWQWTNKDAYPNAWSQDNYEWNYFSRIPDGTFAYYDYSISSWKKIATTYEITVVSYPSNAGSIIGGGVYEEGTTTDIQATAAEGYVFKRWFGDATGTSASIHVTTSGNLIIYAYFEASNP